MGAGRTLESQGKCDGTSFLLANSFLLSYLLTSSLLRRSSVFPLPTVSGHSRPSPPLLHLIDAPALAQPNRLTENPVQVLLLLPSVTQIPFGVTSRSTLIFRISSSFPTSPDSHPHSFFRPSTLPLADVGICRARTPYNYLHTSDKDKETGQTPSARTVLTHAFPVYAHFTRTHAQTIAHAQPFHGSTLYPQRHGRTDWQDKRQATAPVDTQKRDTTVYHTRLLASTSPQTVPTIAESLQDP
ncbi:hypothetical protein BDP55DRAFT_625556 [Colletotrichum godetiae]|uniref:Uncharacterized protein n=1 Tax=Colletotrichum godetiae TaxID=1209918 RepID=A0AAJ0B470_9PEZI|nr:uncharacterized protein BDP55DRAFT_625556 [Colletotrichum godetiae]KAK1701319.1 hypothetical protein BDP55DRAFT_625556 [Colletotrichum godetiae]